MMKGGLDGFDIQHPSSSRNNNDNIQSTKKKQLLYDFQPEPPKIRNSALKNNPMSGITLFRLLRLLYIKRNTIDWWRYKHRIIALLFMGILNTFLSIIEYIYIHIILYIHPTTRAIIQQAKNDTTFTTTTTSSTTTQSPIFVLGHPRTGTTLLHSLLALDEERFTYCNTFMAGFPHCFLFFENIGKLLFAPILSKTRPMDNMKLHFDLPQEDELATNLLSGFLVSPYTSISFMRDERSYRKYQCFHQDGDDGDDGDDDDGNSDDNTTMKETMEWCTWFHYLLTKIKIRDMLHQHHNNNNNNAAAVVRPRRLLLKSPCHTGRARLLLKLYPDAKFVFIHRHPYELFLSGAHMASTTYGYWFLQQPSNDDIMEYILAQGEILHNEYFSCRDDHILHEKVSLFITINTVIIVVDVDYLVGAFLFAVIDMVSMIRYSINNNTTPDFISTFYI